MEIKEIGLWNKYWLADKDGDRKLTNEELAKTVKKIEMKRDDTEKVLKVEDVDKNNNGRVEIDEWDKYIRDQILVLDIDDINEDCTELLSEKALVEYFMKKADPATGIVPASKAASYFIISRGYLEAGFSQNRVKEEINKLLILEEDPMALEKVAAIFKGMSDAGITRHDLVKKFYPKAIFLYRDILTPVKEKKDLVTLKKEIFCMFKVYSILKKKMVSSADIAFGEDTVQKKEAKKPKEVSFDQVRRELSEIVEKVRSEHGDAAEVTFKGLYKYFKDGDKDYSSKSVSDLFFKSLEADEAKDTDLGIDEGDSSGLGIIEEDDDSGLGIVE